MIRLFLACLWVFLPLQALGGNLVIPAEPARVDIPDVQFYRLSYGFQEDESGRFQLQVNLHYRPWISDIERVEHFTFRLQSGTIVQSDDQILVLRLDNRERVVGRHRWWYDPYWQAADDVRIACDPKRQLRRLIIENGCGSFETTGARVAHSHPNSHCVTRNFVETLTFLKV